MSQSVWMKAAVYYGPGDIRIEQTPVPRAPGPDEVCLRVLTTSLCGTDVSQFLEPTILPLEDRNARSGHQGPLILGQEVCGVVAECGESVKDLVPGDRVVVGAGWWCELCPRCREGRPNICERAFVYGLHAPGGLAERALFPARMCARVPPQCSSEEAVLAQPLAVALHALARSRISSGERVAIFGVGGIGSLLLAALAAQPTLHFSELIAIDIDPVRLERVAELGATLTVNPHVCDPIYALGVQTEGRGVDLAIETSGQLAAILQAIHAVRNGGRVLQVGIPHGNLNGFPIEEMVLLEKELITTSGHICPVDLPAALDLLATTNVAERVGTRTILLDNLVSEGFLPLVEHQTSEKIIVKIL